MALLEVSNLGIAFGGLQAVAQLDLSIEKGHLYGLIGPNGAGKTTVFNMLTGVYKPTEGNIVLDGKDITGRNPELISKAGVARTFQNIRLFNEMSVLDNVKVGLHNQIQYGMWTGILRCSLGRRGAVQRSLQALQNQVIGDALNAQQPLLAGGLFAGLLAVDRRDVGLQDMLGPD